MRWYSYHDYKKGILKLIHRYRRKISISCFFYHLSAKESNCENASGSCLSTSRNAFLFLFCYSSAVPKSLSSYFPDQVRQVDKSLSQQHFIYAQLRIKHAKRSYLYVFFCSETASLTYKPSRNHRFIRRRPAKIRIFYV